jgi:hypothetical protein
MHGASSVFGPLIASVISGFSDFHDLFAGSDIQLRLTALGSSGLSFSIESCCLPFPAVLRD